MVFVSAIVSDASSSPPSSVLASEVVNDTNASVWAAVVLGALSNAAMVLTLYVLADREAFLVLGIGVALGLVIGLLVVIYLLPGIDSALAQTITSNPTDPGPAEQIADNDAGYGFLQVVPALMFVYGFHRVRARAVEPAAPPPGPGSAPSLRSSPPVVGPGGP